MKNISQDRLWKYLLTRLTYNFIELEFPETYKLLDLTFEPVHLDKEFINFISKMKANLRIPDKLIQVKTKTGEYKYLYFHVEIQSQKDEQIDYRVYSYQKRATILVDSEDVISSLILVDGDTSYYPSDYIYQLENNQITFSYHKIKVVNIPDSNLVGKKDVLSLFYLITKRALQHAKDGDIDQMAWKRDLLIEAEKRDISDLMLRLVLFYIKECVKFKKDETLQEMNDLINQKNEKFKSANMENYSILEEILPESERKIEREKGLEEGLEKGREEGLEKGREEGLEKGREEGLEEGKRAIAKNMLRQESFDFDLIKDITGLDTDDLLDLINEIKQEQK